MPVHATEAEVREHSHALAYDREVWQRLLLNDQTLTAGHRLVALVVSIHSDPAGKAPAWPSLPDLARQTGFTVNQVRYSLDALIRQHWLERGREFGELQSYQRPLFLCWPPEVGT